MCSIIYPYLEWCVWSFVLREQLLIIDQFMFLTVVNYQLRYFEELEVLFLTYYIRKNYLDIHAYKWGPRVHNVFNDIRWWFHLQLLCSC